MKDQTIRFRCSPSEKARITLRAETSGFGISEYCRQMALTGKILATPRLTPEEIDYFKQLKMERKNWIAINNLFRNKDPEFARQVKVHLQRSEFLLDRFY
ncbi:MAG: hypothetical protein LUD76_06430 [Alistipes sp.]|nr:hypothetical protein [Alistipes sp.]